VSTAQPQSPAQLSPQANQLANATPTLYQGPNTIQKGSLIVFPYLYWKNDPMPCVLVSSVNGYVLKGINLHYLTFTYIKKLLMPNVNNPSFSYYNIKSDPYITSAFRSYLVRGIAFEKSRVIDAKFLLQMMTLAKSFDPNQIRAIRQEIERQLSQGIAQPQATPTNPASFGTDMTTQSPPIS
jgi:hypothetical protein